MRFYSSDPIKAAMKAMEGTEFQEVTNALCQYIQTALTTANAPDKLMFTSLGLLPSSVASSSNQAKADLIASLEVVLRNFGTLHSVNRFKRVSENDQSEEAIPLSVTEADASIEKLQLSLEQFKANGENTSAVLQELAGVAAKLVKLMPKLSNEAVEILGVSPVTVMDSISGLSRGDAGAKLSVYNSALKLYTFFEGLDQSALSRQANQQIVALITALDTDGPEEINTALQQLSALSAAAISRGISPEFFVKVAHGISPLSSLTNLLGDLDKFGGTRNNSQLLVTIKENPEVSKQLDDVKRFLIDLITGENMKLTREISSAPSISNLIDIRVNKHLSARALAPDAEPRELLYLTSSMQLLGSRALELAGSKSVSFLLEFAKLFSRALSALREYVALLDAPDSASVSRAMALRRLKRFIDNLGDVVDDLSLQSEPPAVTSLESLKAAALAAFIEADGAIGRLNASYATSKIVQSFGQTLSDERTALDKATSKIISAAEEALSANKDPEAAAAFTEAHQSLKDGISALQALEPTISMEDLLEKEAAVAMAVARASKYAAKFTDVLELRYDPDNAARLPRKIELPQVPEVGNDLTVAMASAALEGMVPDVTTLPIGADNQDWLAQQQSSSAKSRLSWNRSSESLLHLCRSETKLHSQQTQTLS